MKQSLALADVACAATDADCMPVANVDGNAMITRSTWMRMVRGWHAAFTRVAGDEVGFYFEDTLAFSAALWGLGTRARRRCCSAICSLRRWIWCCPRSVPRRGNCPTP
ncbi:hypothetical protein [Diaphorobacter aerolatus]|uniref:hypothetical protein n=1 Tax=Diaphorobacter aerolatus TaxID=1288495 RepID=UPI001D0144CB|nr:hypothetical protein [Diaphorobacter aerolatus]